jgi:hypothetical protein
MTPDNRCDIASSSARRVNAASHCSIIAFCAPQYTLGASGVASSTLTGFNCAIVEFQLDLTRQNNVVID